MIRKLVSRVAALTLLSTAAVGCGYEVATGQAMGTSWAVTAKCPGALPTAVVAAQFERVEALMSTYDSNSALMRVNADQTGNWIPADVELVDVIAAAKAIARQTDGAFDPTVLPLVLAWGLGPATRNAEPSPDEVRDAVGQVAHERLEVRRSPPAVRRRTGPGALRAVRVDLSGIAKGHAVDGVADGLRAHGCSAFLVELGGEIRAQGSSPSGGPWRLAVDSPDASETAGTLTLRQGGVATSGDYRQYREVDGRRITHIIDPRTGYPVQHRLASVTVVADTAREADAYATALMVMGDDKGPRFAEGAGLAAMFLIRTRSGFESVYSSAMAEYRP